MRWKSEMQLPVGSSGVSRWIVEDFRKHVRVKNRIRRGTCRVVGKKGKGRRGRP